LEPTDLVIADGRIIQCRRCGDYEVSASVFAETKLRSQGDWRRACVREKDKAKRGDRLRITTYSFPTW
jgi:hypothetical protein